MRRREQPPGTVNVGRASSQGVYRGLFGNTFGRDLAAYEAHLRTRLTEPLFARLFDELAGQTLWCPGCGVGAPQCHARVIERLLAERGKANAS